MSANTDKYKSLEEKLSKEFLQYKQGRDDIIAKWEEPGTTAVDSDIDVIRKDMQLEMCTIEHAKRVAKIASKTENNTTKIIHSMSTFAISLFHSKNKLQEKLDNESSMVTKAQADYKRLRVSLGDEEMRSWGLLVKNNELEDQLKSTIQRLKDRKSELVALKKKNAEMKKQMDELSAKGKFNTALLETCKECLETCEPIITPAQAKFLNLDTRKRKEREYDSDYDNKMPSKERDYDSDDDRKMPSK